MNEIADTKSVPSMYFVFQNNENSWYSEHRHFYISYFELDENLSWHLDHNIQTYVYGHTVDKDDENFSTFNEMPGELRKFKSINIYPKAVDWP